MGTSGRPDGSLRCSEGLEFASYLPIEVRGALYTVSRIACKSCSTTAYEHPYTSKPTLQLVAQCSSITTSQRDPALPALEACWQEASTHESLPQALSKSRGCRKRGVDHTHLFISLHPLHIAQPPTSTPTTVTYNLYTIAPFSRRIFSSSHTSVDSSYMLFPSFSIYLQYKALF